MLAQRRHVVQVVSIGLGGRTTQETDTWGRRVIRLGAGRKRIVSPSRWELFRSYLALRFASEAWLRAFSPDLLIAYFAFPAGHAAMSLSRRLRLPMAVSLRGSDVPGFSDARWGWLRFLHSILVRPVLRQCDLLLANGLYLSRLAQAMMPDVEVINLPNGVDPEAYHPGLPRRDSEPLRVLFVGQLITRKNCFQVLEGMEWLATHGGTATLTVVGEGPLRAALEVRTARLAGRLKVALAGHVARESMPEVYRLHDVVVLLSEAEGISNVLLEALASGLCVVGTPASVGEVVSDQVQGILLGSVTPESVGRALLSLATSSERRVMFQKAARRLAESRDWAATASLFEEQVRKLLGQ